MTINGKWKISIYFLFAVTDKASQCTASAFATLTASKALIILIKRYTGENDEAMKNRYNASKNEEDVFLITPGFRTSVIML